MIIRKKQKRTRRRRRCREQREVKEVDVEEETFDIVSDTSPQISPFSYIR